MVNPIEPLILSNLSNNINIVKEFLEKFCNSVKFSSDRKTIRFDIKHNSNAYVLSLDTMRYFNFRTNETGNVIDLICDNLDMNKTKLIADLFIHLQKEGQLTNSVDEIEYNDSFITEFPEVYDKNSLDNLPNVISEHFLKDNIGIETQIKFNIKYDNRTKRIVIPTYFNGELVGAIGRRNTCVLQDWENKYFPILPYRKSLVLFGYDEFYDLILKTKTVVLVESEKSILKMWQMGTKLPFLALGSHSLSRNQIELLKLLQVDKVIFALDKGLDYDKGLFPNIEKLKKYGRECEIKYIDVNSVEDKYLKDKESICDRTKEDIGYIFKNYLKTT